MAAITKNPPFLILAAVVVIGLPLAYFFIIQPQLNGGAEANAPLEESTVVVPEDVDFGVGPTYTVEERVVNLQRSSSGGRYLRLEVVLEFQPEDPNYYTLTGEARTAAQEEFLEEIAPKAPVIEDTVLSVVSSKSGQQVLSPTGKEDLKEEIATAVTDRIGRPKVVNVYLSQFVVQ